MIMSAIEKLLAVAEAEVGYLEKKSNSNLYDKTANAGSNNYTKYANDFDKTYTTFYNGKKNGFAWCDMFVDWCFVKAFGEAMALKLLGQPKKSCGAGCQFSANYYKQISRFFTSPQVGDQIFFKNSSGEACHTGIVYKVGSLYVYTIEGNTSSASGVVANGGAVEKKKYLKSYSKIYGYGRPKYNTVDTKAAEFPKGTKLSLNKVPLYASASTKTQAKKITGTYYIYDGEILSGRYRITNKKANCGKTPIAKYVTGFVNKTDID